MYAAPAPLANNDAIGEGRLARPNALLLAFFGLALLYAFLLALELLTRSVSLLAGQSLQTVVAAANAPLVGISIGLLLTATVQSSSAVTALLVALVSAQTLSLQQAVPIVLGANIGTTFTALLVSFSHIKSKKEFRKGVGAALLHNFFNLWGCLLFYPLEQGYHVLSRASEALGQVAAQYLGVGAGAPVGGLITALVGPVASRLVGPGKSAWLWAVVALMILFGCILLFRTVLRILWVRDYELRLNQTVFSKPWRSLSLGAGLTAFIHSSTVTTTLTVPMAAEGVVSIRKLLPYIIGANIGTTVTALIAALGRPGPALALAFSHFLFNLAVGLLVMWTPLLYNGLLLAVRRTAMVFARQRVLALAYLVLFFFALPLVVIYLSAR